MGKPKIEWIEWILPLDNVPIVKSNLTYGKERVTPTYIDFEELKSLVQAFSQTQLVKSFIWNPSKMFWIPKIVILVSLNKLIERDPIAAARLLALWLRE